MISVCMTTYNGEKFVEQQVNSILSQLTITDELIISDDCSTDGTMEILKSIRDPRVKIVTNQKTEQQYSFGYTSRNVENALKHAKGIYIFIPDQDDIWLTGHVTKLTDALVNADLVMSDCIIVDQDLNTLVESKFAGEGVKRGVLRNFIKSGYLGCCMAFRKEVLQYVLPFPKNVPHDLWIALTVDIRGTFKLLPEQTILYRRHDNNVSATPIIASNKNSNLPKNNHSLWFKINYRLILAKALIRFLLKKNE